MRIGHANMWKNAVKIQLPDVADYYISHIPKQPDSYPFNDRWRHRRSTLQVSQLEFHASSRRAVAKSYTSFQPAKRGPFYENYLAFADHQFPIDLNNVAKDHTNLENDQLQSLYRRLCVLNRCATMRLDQSHKPQTPQVWM